MVREKITSPALFVLVCTKPMFQLRHGLFHTPICLSNSKNISKISLALYKPIWAKQKAVMISPVIAMSLCKS